MRSPGNQLAVAAGIGVADMMGAVGATSIHMHREYTHKACELSPPLRAVARTILWLNGMQRRYWAWTHRNHHDHADQLADPHSPVQLGRKLLFINHMEYRQAVQELKEKEQQGTPIPADLAPDRLDKAIFDKTKLGLTAGFAGHVLANRLAGNPEYMAVVSFAVGKLGYIAAGNFVNTIGHMGKHPWRAMLTGKITPQDDGDYGADSMLVALATGGEGQQKYHHDHPESYMFCEPDLPPVKRTLRDMGGSLLKLAIHIGWANEPSGPPPHLTSGPGQDSLAA